MSSTVDKRFGVVQLQIFNISTFTFAPAVISLATCQAYLCILQKLLHCLLDLHKSLSVAFAVDLVVRKFQASAERLTVGALASVQGSV